jgi:hypothetical protein
MAATDKYRAAKFKSCKTGIAANARLMNYLLADDTLDCR